MDLEDFLQAAQSMQLGAPSLEQVAVAHPSLIADFAKLDAVKTAATFGGLLTHPELQANCLTLEILIHLVLAYGHGRTMPMQGFFQKSFQILKDGYSGLMEDPAEDVFVSLVNTSDGNFRIFEGLREANGFYLQRILNVVDTMPDTRGYNNLRSSINALLKLSDAVASRRALRENVLGAEFPAKTLPKGIARHLAASRHLVRFTEEDLRQLDIEKDELTRFLFTPERRGDLLAQQLGNTSLERRPLISTGELLYFALPTATGSAITRLVIEWLLAGGMAKTFENNLAQEFVRLFSDTPLLGGRSGAELHFRRISGGLVSGLMTEPDPGRFLHLIFLVDGLDGFSEDSFAGMNADPEALSSAVDEEIRMAEQYSTQRANFLDGISILIGCGYGRGLRLISEQKLPEAWRFQWLSAHDLITLSWLQDFDAISVWRVLDAVDAIHAEGVFLQNINGFLNLVAWSKELDGHLVPHGSLPSEFLQEGTRGMISVRQNALRDLRHDVLAEWNPRRVLDSKGRWIRVRKLGSAEFQEERLAPFYASEDDVVNGRLRAVYVTDSRAWWIEIIAPENASRHAVYENWMMLGTWLRLAVPVLEQAYSDSLPTGPVSFDIIFSEIVSETRGRVKAKNAEELRSLIATYTDRHRAAVRIEIAPGFHDGIAQPENIAERVLVEAIIKGAAELSNSPFDYDRRETLMKQICPDPGARWMHRFEAGSFRDYVHNHLPSHPVLIDQIDAATCKIGLGWKVRSRSQGGEIEGIQDCTNYLNTLVRALLDDLCTELKKFDRGTFVHNVLTNHEAASYDRDRWQRTAQANLALHQNHQAALRTIIDHMGGLNASFVAGRILIEAAICECPVESGRSLGKLDFSRLMSKAMLAHYFGGWSDAIYWGVTDPRLRITPLGDVQMNQRFMENVYEPFGRVGSELIIKDAASSYADLYKEHKERLAYSDVIEADFLKAWQAEFHVSLDGMRAFIDKLELLFEDPPKPIVDLRRSQLVEMLRAEASIAIEDASAAIEMFILPSRGNWRVVPLEFSDKDWQPWRFRRRLSVLRRPLISLSAEIDPQIAVAPGLVREAFQVMTHWFYRGQIPDKQVRSAQMRKWLGHANNVQRGEFNRTVADRMKELGWQAEAEVTVTRILGRPLDRNYGDVDVLAWNATSGRVLAIECKDLQFFKTIGEVSEQISDFRGVIRSNGRPDHLRKHLNRIEVLRAHRDIVGKALKLQVPSKIEGHLVFKNPVPMQFAWEALKDKVRLSLFSELEKI